MYVVIHIYNIIQYLCVFRCNHSFNEHMKLSLIRHFVDDKSLCLIDSATTLIILKDLKYLPCFKKQTTNVNTIYGNTKLIEGFGRAHIILPRGTKFVIDDA